MNSSDHISLKQALQKEKKALYRALSIVFLFMILEVLGGIFANSLALFSDALHLFADAGAFALAIFVIRLIKRPPSTKKTYGYERAEVLGALASGLILWALLALIIYEALLRLYEKPEVKGPLVFFIAILGLLANIWMLRILHPKRSGKSLNLQAAFLHVLGDLLGSVGVIVSGLIIWITDWYFIDPIISIAFSCVILWTSGKMIKQSLDILLEGVPSGIELHEVKKELISIKGVEDVHDLHIWAISSRSSALSCHLIVNSSEKKVLNKAHQLLKEKFSITHTTIQIEDLDHFDPLHCYDCLKK